MINLQDLIEALASNDSSLTDALLKTKVLLHEIGEDDLVAWVNRELNGYEDESDLPPYRRVGSQVLASLTNPGFRVESHPIPIGHLERELRERLETAELRQSIAVLEKFAASDGSLQSPLPMELNPKLGERLSRGTAIQKAWCEIDPASVSQTLTEIRSRTLDFVLRLRASLPEQGAAEPGKEPDARAIFSNAVFGDNTTLVIGDRNVTSAANQVLAGNREALAHELRKYGADEKDIAALQKALEESAGDELSKGGSYPAEVEGWQKGMLHKVIDGLWHIELSLATSVLRDALKHFYGW